MKLDDYITNRDWFSQYPSAKTNTNLNYAIFYGTTNLIRTVNVRSQSAALETHR